MIYESAMGDDLTKSVQKALAAGCRKLLHNGKLYVIRVEPIEIGTVELNQTGKDLS